MLKLTNEGLYCPKGDFYIDPWRPVKKALVTHAHADHTRFGSNSYLCANDGYYVTQARLGSKASVETIEYGEKININGIKVSFYPAGHILGSSQIKLEDRGYITVVGGDYKIANDPTCKSFEPVKCHTFISESTFGLPVYTWPSEKEVFKQINEWWLKNKRKGKASLLFAYSLGKAQRIISGIDPEIGPVFTHGSVFKMNAAYEFSGIKFPYYEHVKNKDKHFNWSGAIIVAPPSSAGGTWPGRFQPYSSAFASGWMQIRGNKKKRAADTGFVISDHADWNGLIKAITETNAQNIILTHGYKNVLAQYLNEKGYNAQTMDTMFEGELEDIKD